MLSIGLTILIAGVVVACIGFLIALALVGVRRYLGPSADAQEKRQNVESGMSAATDDKQEMEWDNSALNITVNPLDDLSDEPMPTARNRNAESDDDDDSCLAGGESSDEEVVDLTKGRGLEWDDTTLTF